MLPNRRALQRLRLRHNWKGYRARAALMFHSSFPLPLAISGQACYQRTVWFVFVYLCSVFVSYIPFKSLATFYTEYQSLFFQLRPIVFIYVVFTQCRSLLFALFSGILSVPSPLGNKLYHSLMMGGVMGAASQNKYSSKNNTLTYCISVWIK